MIFQHKPLDHIQKGLYTDIYHDEAGNQTNRKKFSKKALDLGPEIQEDIRELSGEDEQ